MDVATLRQQLKKATPATIYLVLGTQHVLQEQARAAFSHLIPAEEKVMNVGSYDMETTPVATAIDDAASAPFFGERRLVMVDKPYFLTGERHPGGPDHDLKALLNYLKHPQPTTVLVFFAPYEKLDGRKALVKQLKKVAVNVSAAPLNESSARSAIKSRLDGDGYEIDPAAMTELIKRTNADFGLMSANVEKLELLAYQDREITVEQVQGIVPQTLDDNVFDLVNAVLAKNQEQALSLYQQLLSNQEPPLRINAVLVGQFRLLMQVKILSARGLSQGTLASRLSVHPYRVKLALRTVRRFSLTNLEDAFLGLLKIEEALKTTNRDPALLFQLFMLRYSHSQVSWH